MVKVGFVCEGKIERKIIESADFQRILIENNIQIIFPVVDAKGAGNLLPNKLNESIRDLTKLGAEKIIILTDLDKEECITNTKSRISSDDNLIIIVAVKQIEAWFLADNQTISGLLGTDFQFENPENEAIPFDTLREVFMTQTKRGIGDKDKFAGKILRNGFSIENASKNSPSAKYFINKLKLLTDNQNSPIGG